MHSVFTAVCLKLRFRRLARQNTLLLFWLEGLNLEASNVRGLMENFQDPV